MNFRLHIKIFSIMLALSENIRYNKRRVGVSRNNAQDKRPFCFVLLIFLRIL